MGDPPALRFFPSYECRDCGSEVGFRSRRRTLMERFVLPLMLLRPVRCGECFRREYRLVFTKVRDRFSATRVDDLSDPGTPSNRNVA
jgi:hypothetical protein